MQEHFRKYAQQQTHPKANNIHQQGPAAGLQLARLPMWVHLGNGSSSLPSSAFCFLCSFLQPPHRPFQHTAFQPRPRRDVSIAHSWDPECVHAAFPSSPCPFWSHLQPPSIVSNPRYPSQSILTMCRLGSCHFTAQILIPISRRSTSIIPLTN